MSVDPPAFLHDADPDHPGWLRWSLSESDRFNSVLGPMRARVEEDGSVRVRIVPGRLQSNLGDAVHGGATLAFIDVALFAAARLFGLIEAGTAVTLNLDTQFIGAGRIGEPLDAVVELLRETGRLLFLRGLVVQGDHRVAAFSATIRKPSPGR